MCCTLYWSFGCGIYNASEYSELGKARTLVSLSNSYCFCGFGNYVPGQAHVGEYQWVCGAHVGEYQWVCGVECTT